MRLWILLLLVILRPTWAQDLYVLSAVDPAGGYLVVMKKEGPSRLLAFRATPQQLALAAEHDLGSTWQLFLDGVVIKSLIPKGRSNGVHECAEMLRGFIQAVDNRQFDAAHGFYGAALQRSQPVDMCKAEWDVRYLSPEAGHLVFRGFAKDGSMGFRVYSTTTEANLSAASCARNFRGFKYANVVTFVCKRQGSEFRIQSWKESDAKSKV